MAALTDLSDMINRQTGGNNGTPQKPFFWIDNRVQGSAAAATVSGRATSLWQYNKGCGANGAVPPTTAAAPTNATIGAFPFTDGGGGRVKKILGGGFISFQALSGILYDRLLHISGLSGTNTGAQTVGGSLTRNTGGIGNEIWVEIYTQIGASSTTITASYTNQAGTSGRTTQAVAIGNTGLREAQRVIPLPLQDGDTGVQAVASVTLAATTGTAGDFGVTVVRPIMPLAVPNVGCTVPLDLISDFPGIDEPENGACISAVATMAGTTAPQGWMFYSMIEK